VEQFFQFNASVGICKPHVISGENVTSDADCHWWQQAMECENKSTKAYTVTHQGALLELLLSSY
jgi:hypothetical protein